MVVLADLGQPLSSREREVLRWASTGKTAAEIGVIAGISIHTVNQHLAAARMKLGASNTAQACVIFERGRRADSETGLV